MMDKIISISETLVNVNGKTIRVPPLQSLNDLLTHEFSCDACGKIIGRCDGNKVIAVIDDDCGCDHTKSTVSFSLRVPKTCDPDPEAPGRYFAKPRKTWDAGRLFQGRGR